MDPRDISSAFTAVSAFLVIIVICVDGKHDDVDDCMYYVNISFRLLDFVVIDAFAEDDDGWWWWPWW